MPRTRFRSCLIAAVVSLAGQVGLARAADVPVTPPQPAKPLVHAIYAQLPDLPEGDVSRRAFAAAVARYKLAPLEIIDVPPPPSPKAPATLKGTIAKTLKLAFDEALPALDAELSEAIATGGAGLTTLELSDLLLHHAMATARADWNAPTPPQMAALNPGRARAFPDYVRAAALTPDRTLDAHALPPQVVGDFARALDVARMLPRCTLVIHGDGDAEVSLDGAAPLRVAGGLTIKDLPRGDHFIAVTELGRAPWGTSLSITNDTFDFPIPERAPMGLGDSLAADHARRMGASFALVGERRPGDGARMEVRLVDLSGAKRDATVVSTADAEHGALDAAVMRIDEQARKIRELEIAGTLNAATPVEAPPPNDAWGTTSILAAAPRPRATFHDDPAAWARDRWPLLTAIGVVAASALTLSIAASH